MNKIMKNAIRRSRINSEYYCSSKAKPPEEKEKNNPKKGQKVSSPDTPDHDTLPS